MIQRGLAFFTLFVLFLPSFSHSFDDIQRLSEQRYWQQLLHFRDGKSEIDSPAFFLSPKGKTDAKAELEATLEALYHDRDIFCRFPARVAWLYKNIPSLKERVPYEECRELSDLIAAYQVTKAVLVFPTAHINSPASMFGHTFLRLDDQKGLVLTSNAVNYAAKTAETNGLLFAYNGLFGGYEGRYSVLPYYKKIKEYNDLERRDMWEYTLNLSPTELTRLLMHLYEVRNEYADYFFVRENCSYNLLWLLEVARGDLCLVEQFDVKALPVDTIRAVKRAGLIEDVHFRPSKTRRIKAIMMQEKSASGALKDAYKAELDIEILQLARSKNEIEKKSYVAKLMRQLKERSILPTLPELDIKTPANPLTSHQSSRLEVGINNDKEVELGYKAAFHDIYDVERGLIEGAYIDFFHLVLAKSEDEKVKLKKFNLLNINSYAPRDAVFKPLSWGVSVGAEEFRKETYAKFSGEVGVSYAGGENVYGSIMMKPAFYYQDKPIAGIGPKLGVIAHFDTMKYGLLTEKNFYSDGASDVHTEAFGTLMISQNSALNLKIDNDKIGDTKSVQSLGVRLFYYF